MVLTVLYDPDIQEMYTKKVYQYTKEVSLNVIGMPLTLPMTVDISNDRDYGNAVQYESSTVPIPIPNEYFVNGNYIYVWIHGQDEMPLIVIPVVPKSVPVPGGNGGMSYKYDPEDENMSFSQALDQMIRNSMEEE